MKHATIAALILSATAANAQTACAPSHEAALQLLAEKYGEVPVGYGLARDGGAVIEVFVSESGSWTIVRIMPNGQVCKVLDGYEWVFVESPWPKKGEEG